MFEMTCTVHMKALPTRYRAQEILKFILCSIVLTEPLLVKISFHSTIIPLASNLIILQVSGGTLPRIISNYWRLPKYNMSNQAFRKMQHFNFLFRVTMLCSDLQLVWTVLILKWPWLQLSHSAGLKKEYFFLIYSIYS